MTRTDLLLPLFVQVGLTFALLFWMGYERVGSLKRGEVRIRDIALGQHAWPVRATQIANSFHNQFELPVLFYLVIVLALVTSAADATLVSLAWSFVALRLVHAAIHTRDNTVSNRFYIFLAGAFVLLLMWLWFALRILLA